MVKKIFSTAIAMIAISSVANASVLFSADKTKDFGVLENDMKPLMQAHDAKGMALKSLEQTKENGVWRNDMMPLEQSHNNEMAGLNPTALQKVYWQNVQHWSDPTIHSKHQKKSKKS